MGVHVLPLIGKDAYSGAPAVGSIGGKAKRMLNFVLRRPTLDPHYPAVRARRVVDQVIRSVRPEVVLTIWSPEAVAATHGLKDVVRVAYHGDIDYAPLEQRMHDRALFGDPQGGERSKTISKSFLDRIRQRFRLAEYKRAHMAMMQQLDMIANVAASNAKVYTEHGHTKSIYIRNVWSDHDRSSIRHPDKGRGGDKTIKIIGHVGYLNRTGSIYGMRFLLRELLPHLGEAMKGRKYEVHVIGGGELPGSLRSDAEHSCIRMRGYVDDLDEELLSSDMFLLLNNAGPYWAAYTRHVLAWQMGLCLIVHGNSKHAIPEISHMDNALVGFTPRQIAELVNLAATDANVNARVRLGGRATYDKFFTPQRVGSQLSREMQSLVVSKSEALPPGESKPGLSA